MRNWLKGLPLHPVINTLSMIVVMGQAGDAELGLTELYALARLQPAGHSFTDTTNRSKVAGTRAQPIPRCPQGVRWRIWVTAALLCD